MSLCSDAPAHLYLESICVKTLLNSQITAVCVIAHYAPATNVFPSSPEHEQLRCVHMVTVLQQQLLSVGYTEAQKDSLQKLLLQETSSQQLSLNRNSAKKEQKMRLDM